MADIARAFGGGPRVNLVHRLRKLEIIPLLIAAAASTSALAQNALEPSPLGLQGKTINSAGQPDNPNARAPELLEARNDGPSAYCFKVHMDKPFINKDKDWQTVFRMVNTCNQEILYRFDSAEFDGDDSTLVSYTARGSYPTDGGGVPGSAMWPDKVPLPAELGFEPNWRQGEGMLYRGPPNWLGGGREPGTYIASQNAAPRLIKYYIVSCLRFDEQTGRENVMWVSGPRLMDKETRFKCLPSPPREEQALTRTGDTGKALIDKASADAAMWEDGRPARELAEQQAEARAEQERKDSLAALQRPYAPGPVQRQQTRPSSGSGFNFGQVVGAVMQGYNAGKSDSSGSTGPAAEQSNGKCIVSEKVCQEIISGGPH
jgi:hypothetical protein